MSNLTFKEVGKVYSGGVRAVSNFNLEIAREEFIILVGPSGCGKSTVLRMIAGLEDITEGELYIDDRIVNDIAPKDRDIAMVFQNYALYPHMTVYDNLAFGLKMRKTKKEDIEKRVKEAASILGIDELLYRKPKALSGGQRQRVALGRAIVRSPKVFLMDEPLSNLDAKLRVQTRAEIVKLQKRLGTTFIYVTHDQTEAMTMGDKIVVMKDGLIQQVAAPHELYTNPVNLFVAGFIGSPQMNFLEVKVVETDQDITLQKDGLKIEPAFEAVELLRRNYPGKTLVIGIRPEEVLVDVQDGEAFITANVEAIENMGSEKYLYFKAGPDEVTAKVGAESTAKLGDELKISFRTAKIHYFDRDTQLRIPVCREF